MAKARSVPTISDDEIFKRISEGESLRGICEAEGLPESTTRLRLRDDPVLAAHYARARDAQADHYAEKIVHVADTATDASIGRLKMDALKWAASKLAPKRYGDKIAHVGGSEDDAPIRMIEVKFVEPKRCPV